MGLQVTDLSGNGAAISSEGTISLGYDFVGYGFVGLTTNSNGNIGLGYTASALISLTAGTITVSTSGSTNTNKCTLSNSFLYITGGLVDITSTTLDISSDNVQIGVSTSLIGIFGATPVGPQVSGGTLSGVIAGLVALGLFTS